MRIAVALIAASSALASSSPRSISADSVSQPPSIDGQLNETGWQACAWQGGFVQRAPDEGAPATFATKVCVLYDRANLYIALRMEDPETARMTTVMGRRDALGSSDKVIVAIDSYHDHRTGFRFIVNPSGSIADATMQNDNDADFSWDGVWNVATQVGDRGWVAEFEIPFATLRFDARPDLTFGIQFQRYVSRLGEENVWAPQPASSNAAVSIFGHLTGLDRARPGLDTQLLPYTLLRSTLAQEEGSTAPDEKAHPEIGFDLKTSLTGTLTLDATVNPDFGQVEVDPEVVNLTAFETFFPEKRPFFVEGAEIFQTPLQLLYTRRIGQAPPTPAAGDGETVQETASVARIIAGGKVTGRQGRTAIGLLAVGVDDTQALIRRSDGILRQEETSPDTFLGAMRLRQAFGARSQVGGLVTWVGRDGQADAVAGGPDLELRAGDWVYGAHFVAADAAGTTGYGTGAQADYTGRVWGAKVSVEALSPDLNLNDAGFLQRVDQIKGMLLGRWRLAAPKGIFRQSTQRLYTQHAVDYQSRAVSRNVGLQFDEVFLNRMGLSLEAAYFFPVFDNYETRGGSPYLRPNRGGAEGRLYTDESRDWAIGFGGGIASGDGFDSGGSVQVFARLLRRLEISPSISYWQSRGKPRWVETVNDVTGTHYVFGDLDFDQVELRLRATLGLTRTLTLQTFAQYLHARGQHDNFRELSDPEMFGPYAYTGEPDFQTTSLLANVVLRWEYLPLSAVYVVWTHQSQLVGSDPAFEPVDIFGDLANVNSNDVIIAKVSYLWQP